MVATNKVYAVSSEEELVPVPETWGQMPKYELLQPDKVRQRSGATLVL